MAEVSIYIWIALGAAVAGAIFFYILLLLLPRKLGAENRLQEKVLIAEAHKKAATIVAQERQRTEVKLQLASEELDTAIADRRSDMETLDKDLNDRDSYLEQEENRLQRREKELDQLRSKAQRAKDELLAAQNQLQETHVALVNKLASIAGQEADRVRVNLVEDNVQRRQVEINKHMRLVADELGTSTGRLAARMLSRVHSRYSPEFIWPKGFNHVEIMDPRVLEALHNPECQLLTRLSELSEGVNLTLVESEKPEQAPIVRLGGGFGIYKEAAKLALEESLPKGPNYWERIAEVYERHKRTLENKALQLGKAALVDLKLNGMHVEILKMVGALNWRTSYRQNQYHHSIEVSKLAGILATELGVDPDQAKRCGLLHDIGKAIDYRIEGSHAVISGDYADRFGENKIICDTVMSHHADLLVETPLAYVLMSADTLSGARPGARVNLEEGYQDRLTSIQDVIRAFPGVMKIEIMNGAREIHVEVNHKKIKEDELESLSQQIARQIEENVAYPGQIKILVSRRFESVAVA